MPEGNVNIHKILILRFSSLGDIVMATAMVRCVRKAFPHARIDMVVREDFLDLIQGNPHIDVKIGLPRSSGIAGLIALGREINRERYDLIYDAHRSLRTRALMPFLRSSHKAYFRKHYFRRSVALTLKLRLLGGTPRMLESYITPLHRYGVRYDLEGPELGMVKRPNGSSAVRRIGIIPSAQWPGKRWPLHYFRQLMEKLVETTPHHLVIFGGKGDDFCQELVAHFDPKRVENTQGKLSIAQSGDVLATCDLVVANDTGLMHMADALGVPPIVILGPTSAEMGCLPFHPLRRVMEHTMWCRPCSKNGQAPCIRSERWCLTKTSPESVLAAVHEVIGDLDSQGSR